MIYLTELKFHGYVASLYVLVIKVSKLKKNIYFYKMLKGYIQYKIDQKSIVNFVFRQSITFYTVK